VIKAGLLDSSVIFLYLLDWVGYLLIEYFII